MAYVTTETRKGRRLILKALREIKAGAHRDRSGICVAVDAHLMDEGYISGVSYSDKLGMGRLFQGWKGGAFDGKAWPVDSCYRATFGQDPDAVAGGLDWPEGRASPRPVGLRHRIHPQVGSLT